MLATAGLTGLLSCSKEGNAPLDNSESGQVEKIVTMDGVARLLSELPIGGAQMDEVFGAVGASSGNGYDEEYTLRDLFEAPGCGVGQTEEERTRASRAASREGASLRDLISDYLYSKAGEPRAGQGLAGSRDGSGQEAFPQIDDPEAVIGALSSSDLQIYWPYSEEWDGETLPIITFDPGMGVESNYGYLLKVSEDGQRTVEEVVVDESVARTSPVWVVNRNDDRDFTPVEMFIRANRPAAGPMHASKARNLMIKSFKMLRNYDSWFAGASEFFIKCGSIKGFSARTEAELKQYSPSVTDMMIVVRRRDVGKEVPYDAILFSGFTNQLDKLAFLVTEDDGGTRTSWKCEATVKINSKSYGINLDIPFNEKDDIVWRGQLAASFFQSEDTVTGRFGDVLISFALE